MRYPMMSYSQFYGFLESQINYVPVWYLLVSTILLYITHRFFVEPYRYWRNLGVPSAPALPIFGSLYEHFTKDLHEVLIQRYKKYGKVYGYYESIRPVLCVGDPDLLRDILVKDFNVFTHRRDFSGGDPVLDKMLTIVNGKDWKRIRTLISPAFSAAKIKKVSSILMESARTTCRNFERLADSDMPVDCKKLFGGYTMDVIAKTSFGTELDSHNDPENEFVRAARATFTKDISLRFILFFICPWLLKLLRTSVFTSTASRVFEKVARDIIEERRRIGQRHNDFLQLLMDATEEFSASSKETKPHNYLDADNNNNANEPDRNYESIKDNKVEGLSPDEAVAQCIIFMLAGYDTTSSTLSLVSYNLALDPDYQENVIREIDAITERNGNDLTYESVQEMKLLECAVSETLRMYPPVVFIDRMATENYELGKTGIIIKKGMLVSIPIFAIHRDPENYENPDKFDPGRFGPGRKETMNPYTNLSFGVGPRYCIGRRLAIMEIKFCLAILLSKFRLKTCSETKIPLEFFNGPGLLQPKGIVLKLERRTDIMSETPQENP